MLMVLILWMEYDFWETQRWCNNGNTIGIQWDIKGIVMFERWETPCEINMMIYLANLAMVKIHENPILNDQRYKVVPPQWNVCCFIPPPWPKWVIGVMFTNLANYGAPPRRVWWCWITVNILFMMRKSHHERRSSSGGNQGFSIWLFQGFGRVWVQIWPVHLSLGQLKYYKLIDRICTRSSWIFGSVLTLLSHLAD